MQQIFFRQIENSIGFFDIALSFSADCNDKATALASMATYRGLKCYDYREYSENQFGINIFHIMKFVFCNTKRIVVFNSPGYRNSKPTEFEFELIRTSDIEQDISLFQLGGGTLSLSPKKFSEFESFGDSEMLEITKPY